MYSHRPVCSLPKSSVYPLSESDSVTAVSATGLGGSGDLDDLSTSKSKVAGYGVCQLDTRELSLFQSAVIIH